ncbi:MAG: recombination regulator RecX [Clostridia bacterium]|nr:recombination regulator RecX [Clostridia bacterium]
MMDALEKATAYLNRSPHTEKEVIDYLLRKGYEQDEAESAAADLKEYGYIDDLSYAKLYFEYSFEKGRGRDRIVRELTGKGVSREVIDQAYDELEEAPDEYAMALHLAAQIVQESGGPSDEMSYTDRQKLQAKIVRRLSSRGFSGGVCYNAARESVK